MNIMETNKDITNVDLIMDQLYGKEGSPEREIFKKEAYNYCMGQLIHEVRKEEKVTQLELAKRIGVNKSYISRIEKGLIEPGVGTFYRIINALGLKIEISKQLA
jgi:DNA-binding XRE family transcriptional regulator